MAQPQNKNLRRFPRTLGVTNFTTADKTLVAGSYSRVGSLTVSAQQEATFGVSTLRSGGSEGEPVYMRFVDDSGADIDGSVRLYIANAQETQRVLVMEERTERLVASTNDRTQAPLLMEFAQNAKEDSLLIIEFRPDSGSNVTFDYDATNSKFLIPVTFYQ
jgi:hypothetical protein